MSDLTSIPRSDPPRKKAYEFEDDKPVGVRKHRGSAKAPGRPESPDTIIESRIKLLRIPLSRRSPRGGLSPQSVGIVGQVLVVRTCVIEKAE